MPISSSSKRAVFTRRTLRLMGQDLFSQPVIQPSALFDQLSDPNLVLLEAKLGAVNPSGQTRHSRHLPNARVFDLEEIRDHRSPLPHMMPQAGIFQNCAQELGIHKNSKIVVYDQNGIYASPRVRWMFKSVGHSSVTVLNGGLSAWERAGYPTVENLDTSISTVGDFSAHSVNSDFCDADAVASAVRNATSQIIDARSAGRYQAIVDEPRPGLRRGHIPSALNLPFDQVLTESGELKSDLELRTLFDQLNLDSRSLIFYCGSGVTACISALAAESIGRSPIQVYDGSWSEWGIPSSRPIAGRN